MDGQTDGRADGHTLLQRCENASKKRPQKDLLFNRFHQNSSLCITGQWNWEVSSKSNLALPGGHCARQLISSAPIPSSAGTVLKSLAILIYDRFTLRKPPLPCFIAHFSSFVNYQVCTPQTPSQCASCHRSVPRCQVFPLILPFSI